VSAVDQRPFPLPRHSLGLVRYLFECPSCGEFESPISGDTIQCRCGSPSRRVWSVTFDRRSAKNQGHWNPQVGRYVANERQFQDALREGQARQEAEMNMECKLIQVDSRDDAGLAETHGHPLEVRLVERELTERANHDARARANHESLVVP
jgi:hypothetical protein